MSRPSSQDSLDDEMNLKLATVASTWTTGTDQDFANKLEAQRCLLQAESERRRRTLKALPATPEKRKSNSRDDSEGARAPTERKARFGQDDGGSADGAAPKEVPVGLDVDELEFTVDTCGFAYEVAAMGKAQEGTSKCASVQGGGETVETMVKETNLAFSGVLQGATAAQLISQLDALQLRALHAVVVRGVRVVVVSGPAGSGKSALNRLLILWQPSAKVMAPTQGSRRVCQKNIDEVLPRKSYMPTLQADTTCAYYK